MIPLAFPAALLLSGIAMLAREWTDTSLHSAQDLQALSTSPVVARIPVLRSEVDTRNRNRRFRLAAASTMAVLALVVVAVSYVLARDNETLTSLLMKVRL